MEPDEGEWVMGQLASAFPADEVFRPENVDRTVAALVASQEGAGRKQAGGDAAKRRLADAEGRIRKFQAAIAAGVDPMALVDVINTAHAERLAAQAEIADTPAPDLMDAAEVYARIDQLGDAQATLNDAKGEGLAELYAGADLQVLYDPASFTAEISMRVNSVRVRGGTRTPVPRGSPEFRGISMKSNISARWVFVGVQVLLVEVCHGSGRFVIRTSDAGRCRGASEMTCVYW